ncbi:MAG TPA: hypothetical protein VGO47_12875 [Chlamydiales bacterium]|nr:hypothetical protein [Chlamydiales bacterium]
MIVNLEKELEKTLVKLEAAERHNADLSRVVAKVEAWCDLSIPACKYPLEHLT